MTRRAPRILLLFSDDSTLIFATRMRSLLRDADAPAEIVMGAYLPETALSDRQLRQFIPDGRYEILDKPALAEALMGGRYAAIVTSRVYGHLDFLLSKALNRQKAGRARVIAFLGGLDFFPHRGMRNRRNCDAVYLFPRSTCDRFRNTEVRPATPELAAWPHVGFGHPAFLYPHKTPAASLPETGDIYFFTQALSPSTARARLHMLRVMAAIARRNPDRTVWIKLRHLPDENTRHLHRERHDYPSLAEQVPDLPANLKLTACTMDQAMRNAALGITCTSTAAIDLLREGVPTIIHLDYLDRALDPLVAPMQRLFEHSNLIRPLEDLLHLRFAPPDPGWLSRMFCPPDLGADVLRVIDTLNAPARRQTAPRRKKTPAAMQL